MAQQLAQGVLRSALATALAGTLKASLWNGGTINPDHRFMSDSDGAEVNTTGYASGFGGSGRKTLTTVAVSYDTTNNRVVIDCDDFTFVNIGVPAGVAMTILRICLNVSADADSPILAEYDAALSLNGGNAAFTVNASGLAYIALSMAGTVTAKGTVTDKTVATTVTKSAVQIDGGCSIIVSLYYDNIADTVSCSGVTWNGNALTQLVANSDGTGTTDIWVLHNVTAATGDVVASFDGPSTGKAMAVDQVAGMIVTPNDRSASNSGASATPSSGNTPTTTQAREILWGVVGTNGPVEDSAGAWGGSFTADQRDGTTGGAAVTNFTVSTGYRVVTSTGGYSASKTGITSRTWAASIHTFKIVTDVAATLGLATATATAHALSIAAGVVTLALGAAQAFAEALPLAIAQSEQPSLIIRDAETAGVAGVIESSAAAVDPWTGQPWSPPIAVYIKASTNAGIRTGNPYFALVQNHDLGVLTTPTDPFDAFESFSGVARYVGRNGSHTWELVLSLGSMPVQREDPDEPHWLMSYYEFSAAESEDLLCLGVTPSGRIICRIRGRQDTMSPINTLSADGLFHSILMTYDYNAPRFTLYLDDLFLLTATYGTAMSTESGRYAALAAGEMIDFPGPRAGFQSRFMLFNGHQSDTRVDARITRAVVYSDVDPWFWDIPNTQPFTNVPTTGDDSPLTGSGYDFSLDAALFNPTPHPLLFGPMPTTPPQYSIYGGNYTPFVPRNAVPPNFTKLPVPIP